MPGVDRGVGPASTHLRQLQTPSTADYRLKKRPRRNPLFCRGPIGAALDDRQKCALSADPIAFVVGGDGFSAQVGAAIRRREKDVRTRYQVAARGDQPPATKPPQKPGVPRPTGAFYDQPSKTIVGRASISLCGTSQGDRGQPSQRAHWWTNSDHRNNPPVKPWCSMEGRVGILSRSAFEGGGPERNTLQVQDPRRAVGQTRRPGPKTPEMLPPPAEGGGEGKEVSQS